MKAPKKNHQEADFAKKKKIEPKETPIRDFLRKVIFFSIVGGGIWFLYEFFYVRLQVEQTIREISGLEQSVRVLTKRHSYNDTANMEFLVFSGHFDKGRYSEQTKMAKNRFGGALVVAPEMGGTMFSIEVSGIPSHVCKKIMRQEWGNSATLESIRIGNKVFTWEDGLPLRPEAADEFCHFKNIRFLYK